MPKFTVSPGGSRVYGAAAQGVRAGIDATTTPGALQALQGAGGGAPGKVGAFLGAHPGLKTMGPALGVMILEMLMGSKMNQVQDLMMQNIQREGMEAQGAAMDPQAQYYQAMMPQYEQQEEMSRMALMQTLMGGGQRLAEGQELFGGV